jgi:predicted flap endonuclease-1-like 5' DNA nuclease
MNSPVEKEDTVNWSWLSFIVGVLVGWLLEWLIDYIFWRRKQRAQEAEIVRLERQIEDDQGRLRDLEMQAAQRARDLEACRADLEASRADFETSRAELEARRVEGDAVGAATADLAGREAQVDVATGAERAVEDAETAAAGTVEGAEAAAEGAEEGVEQVAESAVEGAVEAAQEAVEGLGEAADDAGAVVDATRAGAGVAAAAAGLVDVAQKDNLKRVEGIGPKIEELLNNAGITSFGQLADTPASHLDEILEAAGPRFRLADPSTWPEQSRLAAEGKWDELQVLQDRLSGGRDVDHDAG